MKEKKWLSKDEPARVYYIGLVGLREVKKLEVEWVEETRHPRTGKVIETVVGGHYSDEGRFDLVHTEPSECMNRSYSLRHLGESVIFKRKEDAVYWVLCCSGLRTFIPMTLLRSEYEYFLKKSEVVIPRGLPLKNWERRRYNLYLRELRAYLRHKGALVKNSKGSYPNIRVFSQVYLVNSLDGTSVKVVTCKCTIVGSAKFIATKDVQFRLHIALKSLIRELNMSYETTIVTSITQKLVPAKELYNALEVGDEEKIYETYGASISME